MFVPSFTKSSVKLSRSAASASASRAHAELARFNFDCSWVDSSACSVGVRGRGEMSTSSVSILVGPLFAFAFDLALFCPNPVAVAACT